MGLLHYARAKLVRLSAVEFEFINVVVACIQSMSPATHPDTEQQTRPTILFRDIRTMKRRVLTVRSMTCQKIAESTARRPNPRLCRNCNFESHDKLHHLLLLCRSVLQVMVPSHNLSVPRQALLYPRARSTDFPANVDLWRCKYVHSTVAPSNAP